MSQQEYRPPQQIPRDYVKWGLGDLLKLYFYFGTLLLAALTLPNALYDPATRSFTILIGALGIWRYGWWFTHVVRAKYYEHAKISTAEARSRADLGCGLAAPACAFHDDDLHGAPAGHRGCHQFHRGKRCAAAVAGPPFGLAPVSPTTKS